MSDLRLDIGIDGGGTGCRVAVRVADRADDGAGDRSGERIAHGRGGPANVVTDPAAAEAAIRGALAEALRALGLGERHLAGARVVAGMAGGRLPGVADAFAVRLPFLAYVVDDSVTALEGAFGGGEGSLVYLGTGSFFIRRDARGITHHGGWGFRLGDEGSAAWLGRRALAERLRIADGRRGGADDPLVPALDAACGAHPVAFARTARAEDFARLAPVVTGSDTPFAAALRAAVAEVVTRALADLAHPEGSAWVLDGGLGRAMSGDTEWAAGLPAGRCAAQGTALDGALAMARSLP